MLLGIITVTHHPSTLHGDAGADRGVRLGSVSGTHSPATGTLFIIFTQFRPVLPSDLGVSATTSELPLDPRLQKVSPRVSLGAPFSSISGFQLLPLQPQSHSYPLLCFSFLFLIFNIFSFQENNFLF